jgi:deoxyribonuclease V
MKRSSKVPDNSKIIRRFISICDRKDYKSAIAFQQEIASLLPGKPSGAKIETICGLDISFEKRSNKVFAAAAVYSYPDLELIESLTTADISLFPYIPGLLAFREGPSLLKLIPRLNTQADLYIFDGQGIAHPRGAGIAGMMGLMLDSPSFGCAKSLLIGEYDEPALLKMSSSNLIHKGVVIGKVLRTRTGIKPVFVSTGYKIDLEKAVEITFECCPRFRIPEPLRAAHRLSNELRQKNRAGPSAGP